MFKNLKPPQSRDYYRTNNQDIASNLTIGTAKLLYFFRRL